MKFRSSVLATLALTVVCASAARGQNRLTAAPAAAVLAPGQRVTVAIGGAAGPLTAAISAPAANATIAPGSAALVITATAIGNAIVHVADASGASVDIPVQVLPAAGQIPDRIRLTVTGDPAGPAFVTGQIAAALDAAIAPTLATGADVRPGPLLPPPPPLPSGFLTGFTLPVTIGAAPGTAAVSGTTAVDLVNAGLTGFAPDLLAFTDDPERITADGVLSRTVVERAHPTRIYYYHENVGVTRRFCVMLAANGSVITHVQAVGAAAGPNIDVMTVGHAATQTFLQRQPLDEGLVLTIAGGKPILERDTLAGPGAGIVGALDLRVLDGGPVTATVLAIPPGADPAAYLYAPKLADDGHGRHGTFSLNGFAQSVIAYSAGGRDVSYRYGMRGRTLPNADPGDGGHDYGDYGVLQKVTFDLDNPTAAPARLYLYEKPLGGDVRSSFLVNGSLTEVGCVRVPERYLIALTDLAAGATGTFDVLTMTDGGSNYPLEIGVTAAPPLPQAPPINAADGCFPKPGGPPAATQPAAVPPGQK